MAKGYRGPAGRGGGNMMAQIAKLQEQMEQAQAELAEKTVTETAGGGAVQVTMTGDQHCREIIIDEELLADGDVELLQDMVLTAVNKALDASRALSEEQMAPFTNMLSGFGMGV
ncbi:MAG TPA: YbaB/EbfC family nucleoid-associated protein [Anaerolineaceae bacterium]|jgi:DNA-binding YbaB/EbfC family protein|nr:YbaB/EbfC family nucleoid-associated protein [Anaerolineaceae bacterium]